MALSKKHYEATARILRAAWENAEDRDNKRRVAEAIADDFASCFVLDNPRFDRQRFLKACGF